MNRILILGLFLGTSTMLGQTNIATGHEVKDGVVERDAQLVIFPERLEVQYTLELNLNTMRKEFLKLQPDTPLSEEPLEAWNQYREALGRELPTKIELKVEDQALELKTVRSQTIEKHSVRLFFLLAVDLKARPESQLLRVKDKNFFDKAGYHRLAMKGLRGVKLKDSSVPYIVSQLPRNAWHELSEQEKIETTTASAKFFLPPANRSE